MRFRDIKQFCTRPAHRVDVSWDYLPEHYRIYVEAYRLDVNPDFQRGHVWTTQQKINYVEYVLQGGISGKEIYVNCPEWSKGKRELIVLVDGKQRLEAVFSFMNNEFRVFGHYYYEFEDRLNMFTASFSWKVNDIENRDDILQWYIMLNSGGTPHNPEEIERARNLIGKPYEVPTVEQIMENANMGRISNIIKERDKWRELKEQA